MQTTTLVNRTSPPKISDEALVQLGWMARKIALTLGKGERGKPGEGMVYHYKEFDFDIVLRREARNACVYVRGVLAFVGLVGRPPFGRGGSAEVYKEALVPRAAGRILALHPKAILNDEDIEEEQPALHIIGGDVVEETETSKGWKVFYTEGDEPVAVRKETFDHMRQKVDRLLAFVDKMHAVDPAKEEYPAAAHVAAFVRNAVEELEEDLEGWEA